MAAAIGDFVGPKKAAAAIGFVTFIFGLGQISGPAVAGVLADGPGPSPAPSTWPAAFAGVAILLSAFLRKPQSG